MNIRTSVLALGLVAAVAVPASWDSAQASSAKAKAKTTVTIKAQGVDLSGKVKSSRQACITNRQVNVIKQVGARGGGDDKKFASDTASSDGSWDTGNTGTPGHFYAKVKATSKCKGDTSPTIHATR